MKMRPEHVDAVGGCEPCQYRPAEKGPGPENPSPRPTGKSVVRLGDDETTHLAIELAEPAGKDRKKRPVAGESYEVTLPDGSPVRGNLDALGKALLVGFAPGNGKCTITFPKIDRREITKS